MATENLARFAEIAVFGDEQVLIFSATLEHLIVARAPRDFRDSNHIMTCFPQIPNYSHGAAFVSDKVHIQDLFASRWLERRTTSSWATLAAP